jgi:hypothetical protein
MPERRRPAAGPTLLRNQTIILESTWVQFICVCWTSICVYVEIALRGSRKSCAARCMQTPLAASCSGQVSRPPLPFHLRGSPRIDIPLVHDDRLYFKFKQQVGNRALDPRVVAVLMADSGVPLGRTRWLVEHFLQRTAGMVTIFGMNQLQAVPSQERLRLVSEKSGGRRTPV